MLGPELVRGGGAAGMGGPAAHCGVVTPHVTPGPVVGWLAGRDRWTLTG